MRVLAPEHRTLDRRALDETSASPLGYLTDLQSPWTKPRVPESLDPELASACRLVTAHPASVGREGYVRPREPVPAQIIQVGLIADLEVVRYAASGQVRLRLQRCCLVIRREGDGSGYHIARGIPQRQAVVRVERRRIHRLAEYHLACGVHRNIRLTLGRVRRHDRGHDQIRSRSCRE